MEDVLRACFRGPAETMAFVFGYFAVLYFLVAPALWRLEGRLEPLFRRSRGEGELIREEIRRSLGAMGVFSAGSLAVFWGLERGLLEVNFLGDPWRIAAELAGLIVWNEAHFYGAHRLLHGAKALRGWHGEHHRSRPSTPFAAFSLHPMEELLLGSVLPLAMLAWDFSAYSLLLFPIWSLLINAMSHMNARGIGFVEHHQKHHQWYSGNYAFLFSALDRIGKTEIRK